MNQITHTTMNIEKDYILSKGWILNKKASHNDYNLYTMMGKYDGLSYKYQLTQYIDGDRKGFYLDNNALELLSFEELCDVTLYLNYDEYKLYKRSRTIKTILKDKHEPSE